jgi:Ser/Thr protein kinase RdoA (MazF antagonist)
VVFQDLTPQHVLDALDAVGQRGDGRILQLNSYENRVFQVMLEDGGAVVAKFYRPQRWSDAQILEEHQFALELAQAEVPVVPPLRLQRDRDSAAHAGGGLHAAPGGCQLVGEPPTLAHFAGHRFAVSTRCAGREPELDDPGVLERIGRFLGRLHAVGRRQPFVHRQHLNPRADGQRALTLLLKGDFVPPEQVGSWRPACEVALQMVATAFEAAGPLTTLRLHGDCHIGNVLWRTEGEQQGPHMVDLDDALQGPAVQDLWMLASGDESSAARRLDALLEGYEQFSSFDWRERALIEPLRTLRMLRHSAWLAERWVDPSFPLNFPFFGTGAYWSQQTAQLREQCELMAAN